MSSLELKKLERFLIDEGERILSQNPTHDQMLASISHGERNMINKTLRWIHENVSEEKSFEDYLEEAEEETNG